MPKVYADTRKYNRYKQNYNKLGNRYLIIREKMQLNKLNQSCRQAGKIQTKPRKLKILTELVGDW